jgi:hypothetical protein
MNYIEYVELICDCFDSVSGGKMSIDHARAVIDAYKREKHIKAEIFTQHDLEFLNTCGIRFH